jgi:hypothetical protein
MRIDASNNTVTDIHMDGASGTYRDIAVGEGSVWVGDCGSKLVYKVDPHTNAVVKEIAAEVYGCEGSIGVGEGAVWVVTAEGGDRTLTRFEAAVKKRSLRTWHSRSVRRLLADRGDARPSRHLALAVGPAPIAWHGQR